MQIDAVFNDLARTEGEKGVSPPRRVAARHDEVRPQAKGCYQVMLSLKSSKPQVEMCPNNASLTVGIGREQRRYCC